MPYPTLASLPDAVKKLPKHAQEIWRKAFNSAHAAFDSSKHRQPNAEAYGAATAWAAVKRAGYAKRDDKWVQTKKAFTVTIDASRVHVAKAMD
ncbi:MAG: hypothetical protein AMJ84_03755 [Acidithiobacillales bacterium SM23_46]|nr:MAG: hypothetical protein AMJ84_03755 [Acidithiobacillales bacterium SM23_46]